MSQSQFNNPFKEKAKELLKAMSGECLVCGKELKFIDSEQDSEVPTVRKYCSKACKSKRNK